MPEQIAFNKPPLSIEEQIALLRSRDLYINDFFLATHFLKTIGYYRLMNYFKPFLNDKTNSNKGFKCNTKFSQILQLYIFDRELRLLVSDALERIEIAMRAAISNTMSLRFGPHWYLNANLFKNKERYTSFLNSSLSHLKRSKEYFIENYYKIYNLPEHPPSWMLMECLSFGTLSQLYNNIKDRSSRKIVGDIFHQYSSTLCSWMRSLTFTRNVCAHHSRLWNRFFINTPKNNDIRIKFDRNQSSFIIQAYIIVKLLAAIAPDNHWMDRLMLLMEEHETLVPYEQMGFNGNWRSHQLWNPR